MALKGAQERVSWGTIEAREENELLLPLPTEPRMKKFFPLILGSSK